MLSSLFMPVKRLVVANDLRDLVVVNTDDATYISSKKSADNIKQIMKDNMDTYEAFFDYNRTTYKEWGIQEILNYWRQQVSSVHYL